MLVKKHKLNLELSKEVYEECRAFLAVKECYVNIFYTMTMFTEKFKSGEWKIAYGYIRVLPDHRMMARHCFIVNDRGEAIDPTLFTQKHFKETTDKEHVSFFMFDDLQEYIEAVENNDNVPDLIIPLIDLERETSDVWAEKEGWTLIR